MKSLILGELFINRGVVEGAFEGNKGIRRDVEHGGNRQRFH